MLTHIQIRQRIADFWTQRQHKEVPGISLIPQNDPTTLFTGSGMQQFVPNLMGAPHPAGTRVWNIQRCVRAQDIDEVGDNRHDIFFEMVGNWSFGDYFKKEQLPWMFELYTDKEHGFGLDPKRLYVSVFGGSHGMARDDESIEIWQKVFGKFGMKCEIGTADTWNENQRITLYDAKKNWWSRAGTPDQMPAGEIGGPDSELFYDFGVGYQDLGIDSGIHPNSDSGRFIEIGNSVFVQYVKESDGKLKELPKKNVDFGGGLERILAAVNGNPDVFLTDAFAPIVKSLSPDYAALDEDKKKKVRIVVDHIRTTVNMAADGIIPGPKEQGYVMRRLVRRAVRATQALNISPEHLTGAVSATIEIFKTTYAPINNTKVSTTVVEEINKYLHALVEGRKVIEKYIHKHQSITGSDIFSLYESTGVPTDDVADIARELGATVSTDGLEEAKKAHADASRGASEQKFKGGLADQSEQVLKYHTATHLIHQALFTVCGSTVQQEGSNITGERLRFDFACDHKPTSEEVSKIQELVNSKITEALPVQFTMMPKEDALKLGAKAFFRDKYPDEVKVYFIGQSLETAYSKELCGGPHVSNTKEIGKIELYKVEKIGKNIFRIYAR
jgi:alanyl-tRNA synthetase